MAVRLKPGVVVAVPIDELEPDPDQPRNLKDFNASRLDRMAASLKVRQRHPVLVRQVGKKKIIFDGEVRWRAAKRGKLKTLLCLLEEGSEDAVERGAGQIITSLDRTPLNAIEIAEFIARLRDRQKCSDNELLAALSKHGVQDVGVAKLDKLLRLVELPAWAKDYMRSGRFSEAHGVAILQAIKFPDVMKEIKEQTAREMDWRGEVTAKEMQETVTQAFDSIGIDLNHPRHGQPERLFPIDICRKCDFYKKTTGTRPRELCMNQKEYERKNAEALQLKQQREAEAARKAKERGDKPADPTDPTTITPRKVKPTADGFVALKRYQHGTVNALARARFDVATCEGCPHKHTASYDGRKDAHDAGEHCFHAPCFDKKQAAGGRQESRREKLREYFEQWLRPVVLATAGERLTDKDRDGLLVWIATGARESFSQFRVSSRAEEAAKRMQSFLTRRKLSELPDFLPLQLDEPMSRELAHAAIQSMTRNQVRWFAQYMKIDLTEAATVYRIDDTYLAMKRKGELAELAKAGGLETIADMGVEELRQALLAPAVVEKIGVPADIESVYREPIKAAIDPDGAFDDMAADELADEMICIECGCAEMDPCETPSGPCGWLRKAYCYGDDLQAIGLCSAPECKPGLKRWEAGNREPSAKAIAARDERVAMMTGKGLEDGELDEAITEAVEHVTGGQRKSKKREAA